MSRIFSVLAVALCLGFASCSQPAENSAGESETIATKLPVVGFTNSSASRAIVPATMTSEDINYLMNCPAITGFNNSSEGLVNGQVLTAQKFLDTTVTFTVNSFTGGINGIVNGTRFTGNLGDGSGSIVVELNNSGTAYWYEERLFVDDPYKIVISDHSQSTKSIIHVVSSGKIYSDNSVLGVCSLGFFSVQNGGKEILAAAPKCEVYLGPWNSSSPGVNGSGVAFLKLSATVSPSTSYGAAQKPTGVLDSSKIDMTIDYLDAYVATDPTYSAQYTLFYKSTSDAHSVRYANTWNGVTVNTAGLAKANLPSDYWIGKSVLDTF